MTLIILTGGIDLSIGSVVALCGVAVGISQVNWHWSELGIMGGVGSLGIGILVGTLSGFIIGGLVSVLNIAPFVITLGAMVIARGLALIISDGGGISPMGDYLRPIGEEYLSPTLTLICLSVIIIFFVYGNRRQIVQSVFPLITFGFLGYAFLEYKGFPVPVLFLAGTLAFCSLLLTYTTLGRSIYAVGSNEQAAHWAGVPVRTVKWFVYSAMGFLSGLAGTLLTARLNSAMPTAGELAELDAIAAVVIGGTSLKGGTGSIIGSFVGALTIATLNNGMDLLGVPSFYQNVFKGLIIIVAVGLDKGHRQQN
jgi:D-xylose transport system permease protein